MATSIRRPAEQKAIMTDSPPRLSGRRNLLDWLERRLPMPNTFRRQLRTLKWLIPVGLVVLVVAYEIGPSRWAYQGFGFSRHLLIEILLFGTVGPLLAFFLLELLSRWIDEKETADLQADLLAQASEKESKVRQLSDDTIQVLFAASLLMNTIKSDGADLLPGTIAQIETTEHALNESIAQLRSHLLS
jgi:signal transduction histidine kinase